MRCPCFQGIVNCPPEELLDWRTSMASILSCRRRTIVAATKQSGTTWAGLGESLIIFLQALRDLHPCGPMALRFSWDQRFTCARLHGATPQTCSSEPVDIVYIAIPIDWFAAPQQNTMNILWAVWTECQRSWKKLAAVWRNNCWRIAWLGAPVLLLFISAFIHVSVAAPCMEAQPSQKAWNQQPATNTAFCLPTSCAGNRHVHHLSLVFSQPSRLELWDPWTWSTPSQHLASKKNWVASGGKFCVVSKCFVVLTQKT